MNTERLNNEHFKLYYQSRATAVRVALSRNLRFQF